ncbi:1-aminocyclopropane-1-carboxylate deaminase/D-cysteine desulfhydrase [Sphingobacterium paludis]|uniref:1-aminocyclopropane-1-carboxylate deaminase n=1 Tax=Sphingobacterium paludis TaxID=1476465 RepID=A0A4R7D9U4_9SPHI|nr:pyridoxal-phosphate dependent enzyme [Sphingobacterium paludis]TDS17547.1 1-aminocyclopropane-1-carboxylate deaminase [Sphingobacterium paludis]
MLTFDFHSPVEEISLPLYAEKQVRVFMKRDDLIHPYISGNKWRKLKYTLNQAKQEQRTLLVTFGGAWSNHLLATACAGAKFGFQTYAFVRGERIDNPVLKLCQIFGMQLEFVDRQRYKNKEDLFHERFGNDQHAYFIDEGGYGKQALIGCSEIIDELADHYDHIFCACGTGTTAAGLLEGIHQRGLQTTLHAVPVLKGGEFLREEINKLTKRADDNLQLHSTYHAGGYAKTTPALIQFINEFTQQTGILLEPTYTGKLLFAVHDLLKKNEIPAHTKILILHTGGLTGLLGMLDKF